MRVIVLSDKISPEVLGCEMEPGVEYLLHDRQCQGFSRWRTMGDCFARKWASAPPQERAELEKRRPAIEAQEAMGRLISHSADGRLRQWKSPANLDKKSILFFRAGGYGDMLMMAPLFRKIKVLWKKVRIGVACLQRFAPIIPGIPAIDAFVPFPTKAEEARAWDYHVNFEDTIEFNPLGERMHGAEAFGEAVGLPIRAEDQVVEFDPGIQPMPSGWPEKKENEKWIGVFIAASAQQRNWPVDWMIHLIDALAMEGYVVFPLGAKGDLGAVGYHAPGEKGNVFSGFMRAPRNIAPSCGAFSNILQTAEFMRRYLDLVVSPDTVGVHLCGAMKIPCIAIYGPFPAELRMKYYPTVTSVQGEAECAPCFSHDVAMPCGLPWCKAMDSILPEQIYRMVKEICPRSEKRSRIDKIRLLPGPAARTGQPGSPLPGRGHFILPPLAARR